VVVCTSPEVDMALFLTALIAGEDYAKMVQLVTEYYPKPPLNITDITGVPKQIEENASIFENGNLKDE
jgi:hypothetical protein